MPAPKQFRGSTIDGQPATDWPRIQLECAQYPRFLVEVREYNEEREISLKQMAYFHAVVVPLFVDYTGDCPQYWENRLKLECGSKWFKPETIEIAGRQLTYLPSKTRLSTKHFSEWYQNIRDYGDSIGVLIPPPDPEWRLHAGNKND